MATYQRSVVVLGMLVVLPGVLVAMTGATAAEDEAADGPIVFEVKGVACVDRMPEDGPRIYQAWAKVKKGNGLIRKNHTIVIEFIEKREGVFPEFKTLRPGDEWQLPVYSSDAGTYSESFGPEFDDVKDRLVEGMGHLPRQPGDVEVARRR
jgi:hypothetical protein